MIDHTDDALSGLFNAGRYSERVGRDLTDAEYKWFLDGFVPATVKEDLQQ